MDKNTIIGFILIAAVLFGFFAYSNKVAEEQAEKNKKNSVEYTQPRQEEEPSIIQNSDVTDDFFTVLQPESDSIDIEQPEPIVVPEQIVTLENPKLKIDFSTKGGQMLRAQIKGYSDYKGDSLLIFDQDANFYLQLENKKGKPLRTSELDFYPIESKADNSLIMRYAYSSTQYIDFQYKLSSDDYRMEFDINVVGLEDYLSRNYLEMFELHWGQDIRRLERSIANEQRYSRMYHKYVGDDVNELSESKNEQKEVTEPTKWIAFKNQFFASILIADEEFETVLLDTKMLTSDSYLKSYNANMYLPSVYNAGEKTLSAGFSYYMGPLQYSHLHSYDDGVDDIRQQLDLDKLVPLGWALFRWVNQYFIIPLFNVLNSIGMSVGLVIFLLTLIVKIVISPLTYKSFMSSAKMRVLRPEIEEIGAKYPKQEQAMEKQQAVMALYRKVGVNPMSGCIPLLLQMPILIALFSFFPSAIELRHQSFLWAADLSTYDAIVEWGTPLPLIGTTHLSLFCILMTITNVIYTKFNMEMTNTGQQQMPGMKWMMYLMPLIFLFVLNDYPSGLTYYYFLSLLITILLTVGFRFAVNEEKLLAKLQENKKKPKKKSGFMARLEEAQRIQQQQMQAKNKANSTKKKR